MNGRILCLWVIASTSMIVTDRALASRPETNLVVALTRAETEHKLLFVQYGREICGNCQELKAMIRRRRVKLPDSEFIYADINGDNPDERQVFFSRFSVDGSVFPFVVIADPSGRLLAAHSGYGTADEFIALVQDARRAYRKAEQAHLASKKTKAAPTASGISSNTIPGAR